MNHCNDSVALHVRKILGSYIEIRKSEVSALRVRENVLESFGSPFFLSLFQEQRKETQRNERICSCATNNAKRI